MRDHGVAVAFGDEVENLALPEREGEESGRTTAAGEECGDVGGESGTKNGLALVHRVDGAQDLLLSGALEQVAASTRSHGV